MPIVLAGAARKRFRDAIRAHRNRSTENDASYAKDILKVSLNTFKKCVSPDDRLSLKRHSLINILKATGLDPASFGLEISLPAQGTPYGGYSRAEYSFIAGRYLLFRRSFLTGLNITRAVLDIACTRIAFS